MKINLAVNVCLQLLASCQTLHISQPDYLDSSFIFGGDSEI